MAPRYKDFYGTKRFQVFRRLGQGGMGVVYEALDRERGCPVALKTVRSNNAAFLLRLKNEFRSLQDLDHPNLVRLGELLEDDGHWFFTMDLVVGVSFMEYVRGAPVLLRAASCHALDDDGENVNNPAADTHASGREVRPDCTYVLDESRLRATLPQLASGLLALHAAGKVHRDVKPSNVLVNKLGQLVILDFGLAADIESAVPATPGEIVGSAHYMAPEQTRCAQVGPEADWYSVGVMLYEALVGAFPFEGGLSDIIFAKRSRTPRSPRSLVPTVPPDLDAMCMELLRPDPESRLTGTDLLARLPKPDCGESEASSHPLGTLVRRSVFVGREQELECLGQALHAVRDGKMPVVVLVEGVSGVGKTALVRTFLRRHCERDNEMVVLSGRCYERELVPYKAMDGVVDSLSQYMMRLPDAEVTGLLPHAASLLVEAFPVLRCSNVMAQLPRKELHADHQELRTRMFASLRELLERLAARHPVVITIDDLQWADFDGLALLREILRPPDAPPILLLATIRTGAETSTRMSSAQLARSLSSELRCMLLERLSLNDAKVLAAALMEEVCNSAPNLACKIAEEADGHPLFIQELAYHVGLNPQQRDGELHLDDVLRTRVADLSAPARRVLTLIAVAGRPVVQDVVARALAIPQWDFMRSLRALRTCNLVQTAGHLHTDRVAMYHDRVREALVAALNPDALAKCHRQLAEALEASDVSDPEALAEHWRGAGESDKAVPYAVRAAEDADGIFAFDHAAQLYRLAIEMLPAHHEALGGLRIKLANALANAGRSALAAETYLLAVPDASPSEAVDLRRRSAEQFLRAGYVNKGLALIESVLATVGMGIAKTPFRALLAFVYCRLRLRLRGLGFKERSEAQIPSDILAKLDICWSVAGPLSMIDNIRGADFTGRALLLALRAGEPGRLAIIIAFQAVHSSIGGLKTWDATEKLVETASRLADKVDQPAAKAFAGTARAYALYFVGRFRECVTSFERAETILCDECRGRTYELDSLRRMMLNAFAWLGELKTLSARVPALLAEAIDRGNLYAATNVRLGVMNLAWLVGDRPDVALQMAHEASQRWATSAFTVQHMDALIAQVNIALYTGNSREAFRRTAESWQPLCRSLLLRIQSFRVQAVYLRARCALALAQTTASTERKSLLQGAALSANRLERESVPYARCLAQLIRAAVADGLGDSSAALRHLSVAIEGFRSQDLCLHASLAERIRGRMIGGDEGTRLVALAEQWLATQSVQNAQGFSNMLAPGFRSLV